MTDKPALPKPPPTITRVNDSGLIEHIDIHTGRIVAIESKPTDSYVQSRFDNLIKIDTAEGPVYLEKHLDPERVLKLKRTGHPPFSLAWASLIANRLLTPRQSFDKADPLNDKPPTLKEAIKSLELSHAVVARWRSESDEFDQIIDAALRTQAQLLQDEALEVARDSNDANLQVDTLMKQAKAADSAKFGDKQKVDHSHLHATTIIVETGIRRKRDAAVPEGFEEAIKNAIPVQEARPAIQESLDESTAIPGDIHTEPSGQKSILDAARELDDPIALPVPNIENSGF